MKIVLHEEESLESERLCEELREQARRATQTSAATDRLEWKAARAIEKLVSQLAKPHSAEKDPYMSHNMHCRLD